MKEIKDRTIQLGPMDSVIVFRENGEMEAVTAELTSVDEPTPPSTYMLGITAAFLRNEPLMKQAEKEMLAWIKNHKTNSH